MKCNSNYDEHPIAYILQAMSKGNSGDTANSSTAYNISERSSIPQRIYTSK